MSGGIRSGVSHQEFGLDQNQWEAEMLLVLWVGTFEDCCGKQHKEFVWFSGKCLDEIHEAASNYVTEIQQRNDWCLVANGVQDIKDTRN